MSKENNIQFFIGESIEVTFTVVVGSDIKTTAAKLTADTSLDVDPIREVLVSGELILFDGGAVATVDAAGAVIGATSIPISAMTGNVQRRENGQKVQNISTWSKLAARFKHQADDTSSPIIEKLQSGGDITFVAGGADGKAKFTLTTADTKLFAASGLYVWDAWREDAGAESTLIYGAVDVLQAPSQAPT